MLAAVLEDTYVASSAQGRPLALKVFVSGRGRLENEGAKALSEVFKVSLAMWSEFWSEAFTLPRTRFILCLTVDLTIILAFCYRLPCFVRYHGLNIR